MISSLRPFAAAGTLLSLCFCACIHPGAARAASSSEPDNQSPAAAMAAPRYAPRIMVAGPLRSFLRMAGISQEVQPDDVLPLLARNSYLLGYGGNTQTEYLRLLNRYLHQARELQVLAGTNNTIHVANCRDAEILLRVLGYRLRGGCAQKDFALETTNPTRAFLTIDSGFPLTELEQALQNGAPFDYAYAPSWVPVLYNEGDWLALSANKRGAYASVVDVIANDPVIARLYWAMSKSDAETRLALQRSPGLSKLLPLAAAMDFYGSQLSIRSGRVMVPGGADAERSWRELAGANPDSPGEFITHLLAKDNGWLAAYYDAMSRIGESQREHLMEPARLKRLYDAFRSPGDEPPATIGVFRKAPNLLVLFTRLQWESSGEISVPGGLNIWKEILKAKADSKAAHDVANRARNMDHPEQLLEAMTAESRMVTDTGALQIYLTLSELDSERPAQRRLSAETVRLLADHYSRLNNWYLIFTEFPGLSDDSIARFVNTAQAIDKISDQALRGNTLGAFQANVGLWQVAARQREIADGQLDRSWQSMIDPFSRIGTSAQLFDAAHGSLGAIMLAATGKTDFTQDEIVDLLAGPAQESPQGQQVHAALAGRIRSVLNDQRLVSADTLFALGDGLNEMAQGKPANDRLLPLAAELRDFEMPRQIFSRSEKTEWAPNSNTGRHAELQTKVDLTKVIKTGSPGQLAMARGQLAPLLRDTLVGLNYAYYEPPGAQILHINSLFVRSHDFLGTTVAGSDRLWQSPMLFGAGVSAGGGAYLVGSLTDLPYSLATAEEDMIAPENVQALIWKELVPELLSDAVVARWWDVTPHELHAVALYQRFGEELLGASVKDAKLRGTVIGILSDRMESQRLRQVEQALQSSEDLAAMLPSVMPSETFTWALHSAANSARTRLCLGRRAPNWTT